MDDRELLILAAKAVGHIPLIDAAGNIGGWCNTSGRASFGRPLDDDGDALRMAVKLRFDITFYNGFQEVHVDTSSGIGDAACEQYGSDPFAATRRAIVRAAAEIGKLL